MRKIRLNGGAGARHGEGERIGSGITQLNAADFPAGENVARVRHGFNSLFACAKIHGLTVFVGGFPTLHAAVLRFNGSKTGILEDDLALLQHIVLAIYDVEIVLCPIPAITEGVACLVVRRGTISILGQTAEIESCAGGEHHVVMDIIIPCFVAHSARSFPHLKTPISTLCFCGVGRQGDRGDQRDSRVIIPTGNHYGSNSICCR